MVLLEVLDRQRKSLVLILLKKTQVFFSSHYNAGNSHLFIDRKETFKLKTNNKHVNFPTLFCLGSTSSGFSATESIKVCLNGNVYDFSIDYNCTDKSGILNIHKCLITKNNIK